jgi:hypothetical protein
MDINREEGILYLCSRNSSSSDLVYYDLNNNVTVYKSSQSQFPYNSGDIYYDGNFVHYFGRTFNALDAGAVSSTGKARLYSGASEYSYINTVYDNGGISVFTALKDRFEYETVIYDIIIILYFTL